MRRTLLLALAATVGASVAALAQEAAGSEQAPPPVVTKISGSVSVKASSGIDQTSFDHPDNNYAASVSPSLSLSLSSSQGDAWSLSASLLTDTTVINAGKITATTPLFKVSAVEDKDNQFLLSKVGDPLDLVVFNETKDDGMKDKGAVRIETSALGPSLTLQVDDATGVGLAASASVGPATVGTVVVPSLPTSADGKVTTKLSGYAKAGLGIADVTVGVGTDRSKSEKNLGYGLQVTVKPTEIAEVNAKYVAKQDNFGDSTTLGAGVRAKLSPIEASVDYSTSSKTSAPDKKISDSIQASVSYKASGMEVSASYTTEHGKDTDHTNPKNTISGSVKFGVVPDVATLSLDLTSESDADRELSAFTESTTFETVTRYVQDKDISEVYKAEEHKVEKGAKWDEPGNRLVVQSAGHLKVGAGLEYKLSSALTLKPSLAYHSWNDLRYRKETDKDFNGEFERDKDTFDPWTSTEGGSVTALELGLTASYKVSDAVSVEAGVSQTRYSFKNAGTPQDSAAKQSASLTVKVSF